MCHFMYFLLIIGLVSLLPALDILFDVFDGWARDNTLLKREISLHSKEIEPKSRLKLGTNGYNNYYKPNWETYPRENATLLMLVRNEEILGALKAMRSLEDRFNHRYNYPWTFLNDKPFNEAFIKQTSAMASGDVEYHLIPSSDWDVPGFINTTLYEECLVRMEKESVMYGQVKSYHNMCHFNSGYFFKQKVLDKYDYYFRVEPDVEHYCDFGEDPFRTLRTKKKKYGFVISLPEYHNTVPTLWENVEGFMKEYPQHIHPNNSYDFITYKGPVGNVLNVFTILNSTNDYNLCHFWSNFEIADLNFFRSQAYTDFFNYLDAAGGFYYERWGDAPVHSLAVALLLDKDEVYHFDELGYMHDPFYTCPRSIGTYQARRCVCDVKNDSNIDISFYSCLPRWWKETGKYFMY